MDGEFASSNRSDSIRIAADHCVFQLKETNAALILVDASRVRDDIDTSIEMTALESVVEPGIMLFARVDPANHQLVELSGDEQFQGLLASEIKFAGAHRHRAKMQKSPRFKGPETRKLVFPELIRPDSGQRRNANRIPKADVSPITKQASARTQIRQLPGLILGGSPRIVKGANTASP